MKLRHGQVYSFTDKAVDRTIAAIPMVGGVLFVIYDDCHCAKVEKFDPARYIDPEEVSEPIQYLTDHATWIEKFTTLGVDAEWKRRHK